MDDIWHVWNGLERREDELKWSGHPPGLGAQYDSLGRPAGWSSGANGGSPHGQTGRLERVRRALDDSGPMAQDVIARTLAGISLPPPLRNILVLACQDIALFYGGSVAIGGFVDSIGGAFLGGVRAGAAAGGHVPDGWVMRVLGLRSLAGARTQAVTEALHHHEMGFLEAWGPVRRDDGHGFGMTVRGDPSVAAFHLSNGHAIMIGAILAALVAYLAKNTGGRAALLAEIRLSPRLGPKVAGWVEENEAELRRHPALQSRGWGAADYEASASMHTRQPAGQENTGNCWNSTVAAWRADNPTYQVIPQVDVHGKRETAEQQLNASFGLNKKITFSDANPSRIEAPQSIWSSYANITGAYRSDQIGLGDAVSMAWDNTKFAYQGSQRTQGAAQAINGGLEVKWRAHSLLAAQG